jgi:hypothetical protein
MTIRISFSDKTVRVAVEINGAIESAITELPQRTWVGLTDEEIQVVLDDFQKYYDTMNDFARAIEAKLRSKNENR